MACIAKLITKVVAKLITRQGLIWVAGRVVPSRKGGSSTRIGIPRA